MLNIQPLINPVDRRRAMADIPHRLRKRHVMDSKLCGYRHAPTVKAGVGCQPGYADVTEKVAPALRWSGTPNGSVGVGSAIGYEAFKERAYGWMQRSHMQLITLFLETDSATLQIDLGLRVQLGGADTATVMAGYFKAVTEKLLHRAFGHGADMSADHGYVASIVRGFLLRWFALNTKVAARVRHCVATSHGFVHHKAKQVKIVQGGIVAYTPTLLLSPVQQFQTVVPGQIPWRGNYLFTEEHANHRPCTAVRRKGVQAIPVAFAEEVQYPCVPAFVGSHATRLFLVKGLGRTQGINVAPTLASAKGRRLPVNDATLIPVLYPVDTTAQIVTSHGLCPVVPFATKRVKTIRQFAQ